MTVIKKPKPAAPYDPYNPYGNHSLPWFQQQANQRAAGDTTAAVAALPSPAFYTDSAAQLAKALQGIQGQQSQVAAAGTPLYQQAFDSASGAANKAAMTAGGTGVTATPGGGSLVGALGATMAQALSGGQSAAVARGRNDVLARAGQESAIRAKQPGAAAAYLKEMTDTALQARVAQFNQQLAQSQFGLNASNIATDNTIAQQNADTAASRAAASAASSSSSAAAKQSASLTKALTAARKAAKDAKTGTKSTRTIAGDYTYKIPNSVLTGDPTASGTTSHVVRAKDGNDANTQLAAWIKTSAGYDPATPVNPASFIAGPFKPVTQDSTNPGSRSAQLHAALDILMTDYGMGRAQALQYAREIIGSAKLKPKKKAKPSNPGATGPTQR